jgi:hypothetical protein
MNLKVNRRKTAAKSTKIEKPCRPLLCEEKSIEQMSKDQGARPITDFSLVSGGWEDVDIDAFIKEVRGGREN